MVSKWLGIRGSGIREEFIVINGQWAAIHDSFGLHHEGSESFIVKLSGMLSGML